MAKAPQVQREQNVAGGPRERSFGRFLYKIRTEIYEESLREFSKRTGLSPSYLNKLELAELPTPRRDTVMKIAERLGMEPDALLLRAGFVPDAPQRGEDDEYLLLLIGTLDDAQRHAVREFIKLVQETGMRIPQKGEGLAA